MAAARHWEQDKEATVYVGNLDERVTDAMVWELMLQAGRIQNVHLPKDRVTQVHQGFGFVEFLSEDDAEYASKIMNQIRLFGKAIRVNKASADKQKSVELGAELFIGNLDGMVDERSLYETFMRFGTLTNAPKIARDESNLSKGYGFVSFTDFESADAAIAAMNGQYLMNKEISVQYAYKKDGKGDRHGDEAERRLATQARKNNVQPAFQPLAAHLFHAPPSAMPPPPSSSMAPQGYAPPPMPGGAFAPPPNPYGGPPPGAFPPPHMQNNHHGHNHHHQNHHQQQQQYAGPGPRSANATPLPPAPSGLPARPPPSAAGYGGPPNMMHGGGPGGPGGQAPGFAPPPPGFPQHAPGFGAGGPPAPPSAPSGFQGRR